MDATITRLCPAIAIDGFRDGQVNLTVDIRGPNAEEDMKAVCRLLFAGRTVLMRRHLGGPEHEYLDCCLILGTEDSGRIIQGQDDGEDTPEPSVSAFR